jgi:antitoxin PrlF
MNGITTVTSKGQATIPKDIRDALGLRPHDKVRFTLENGHVIVTKAYPSLRDVVGSLGTTDVPMEEWSRLVHEERARAFREKFG